MSHLAPLISDLALILISAGIMTLLFKKLKQPLVLGYIVAGFVCSPHFTFTPSVVDADNIQTWSEIGVIFLLFALGLEFSFKKLMKVGGSAVISACTIIFCMILVGVFVGWMFGWKQMDCIYLGGMLAMSSTTIINPDRQRCRRIIGRDRTNQRRGQQPESRNRSGRHRHARNDRHRAGSRAQCRAGLASGSRGRR